jgi:Skp family chaperone for outer membrane proteins
MVMLAWHAASDLKIAYVDLSRVFDSYQKTKEFDADFTKRRRSFSKRPRCHGPVKIRDAQSKLDLMKDEEKVKMQADIEKQKNDVVAFDKQKRAQLSQETR